MAEASKKYVTKDEAEMLKAFQIVHLDDYIEEEFQHLTYKMEYGYDLPFTNLGTIYHLDEVNMYFHLASIGDFMYLISQPYITNIQSTVKNDIENDGYTVQMIDILAIGICDLAVDYNQATSSYNIGTLSIILIYSCRIDGYYYYVVHYDEM